MLGTQPSTFGGFLETGGRGTNGADGGGGSGGAGGGGGAGESCFVGSDGAGAGGGGGGGGGEGGTGGTGGWSGGHAIALFLVENGSNGQVLSCDFGGFAGSGGTGGTGGIGGIGGVGGAGGGDTSGDFEIGCGGTGGAGGTGGKGGDGGDGRPGEVHVVSVASGLPLETDESIGSITPGDFDNSNIWVDDIPCTNRTISYTDIRGHAITEWTFGSGAVPATATGRTVSTTYTTPGIKTIIVKQEFVPGMPEIDTFTNFITITEEPIAQASFTTTAPQINGTYTIATGSSINFAAADAGETYAWNMDGGSTPNTFEGDEFKELNNITFNTPGTYTINLLYKNECCGDSEAATLDVVVENALPVTWSHLEAKLSRGGKSVLLDWRTVREENNSGFEIWRAKDSRNWEYLAFVDGRGTSDVSTNYTYEDEQPRVGRNFYRLVQVDFGGAEHISQIVDVLRSSTASLGLYPNPTKGILNITGVPAGRSYQVRNSVGQLLMAGKVTAEALQVEQLVGGVYYLVVGTEIQRFIVKPKG
jgi:PKD repeat protein